MEWVVSRENMGIGIGKKLIYLHFQSKHKLSWTQNEWTLNIGMDKMEFRLAICEAIVLGAWHLVFCGIWYVQNHFWHIISW